MSSRQHYLDKLADLQRELLRMGCSMEEAVKKAITALVNHDAELAQEVIDGDDDLDDLLMSIESQCVKLIATEQPVAKDLRLIFTALKISTDLERMADYAVDIAKVAIRLADEVYIKPLIDIPRMADLAIDMVQDSLEAYVKQDASAAEEISRRDDIIDGLYKQIFRELLTYMIEDPKNINQATYFIFVARSLERVGDHATNVCEWIIYLATGERKDLNN
jgi:phosphate transport system protein